MQNSNLNKLPEAWLRDTKTTGLIPLLQPIINTWTGVVEEIEKTLAGFPEELMWETPANCASVGFHIQHIAGVIDRLLTYAEGKSLSELQFKNLQAEAVPAKDKTSQQLLDALKEQINSGTSRLCAFNVDDLTEPRKVGRAGLPANVMALCFHAAEHSMRHTGQLLVTARVLMASATYPS